MNDHQKSLSAPAAEPDRNLIVVFSDAYLRLRRYFNQLTKEFGLTSTQWQVLRCLSINDGMTQTEIAEVLDMGKSPLGKKIDSLEASGWVYRKTDESDRRAKHVYLTGKVDQHRERLMAITDDLAAVLTKGVSDDEIRRLINFLIVMRENLDQVMGGPPSYTRSE